MKSGISTNLDEHLYLANDATRRLSCRRSNANKSAVGRNKKLLGTDLEIPVSSVSGPAEDIEFRKAYEAANSEIFIHYFANDVIID